MKTIKRLANGFFLNKEVLYKRTPDLGLLVCGCQRGYKTAKRGARRGMQMNGFILAKKSLRTRYYGMTMEHDSCKCVQKCHQCQIHGDLIKVPLTELHVMSSPWPFVAWGMDVIGPIEPPASNRHRFILVAIDYFTKCVEETSHKAVTRKVVADFVKNNLICRFDVLESIITDNGANLNSHLMKDICEQFKITHKNSTAYRPQKNGAVEAANKNIKRILRKMVDNYKNWHEQLPYAFLGYRTTTRTSTGAAPYLLFYGTEAVILAKVEIPSLRIIQEVELKDAEWVRNHYEQLAMIEEKRMVAQTHHQLAYSQQRRKSKIAPMERDQKGHNKMGNKDTSSRKGQRANERKEESDQKDHTKGEQQKISDREGHS
ncbi:uncharacterized protein LOC132064916 [Lycium ferocissimum]|uniref:uncharacterized protein LOC132064916 n=1 Tax=Lycium ferocissimum TaxID=112874 RepID=UPI0028165B26|nr:uncharacterized protein LOC132064916 [Lycium ferocissimum]